MRYQVLTFATALLATSACTKSNPAFCESEADCSDPEAPFCDIAGEHGGSPNACIPNPFDAGVDLPDAAPGPDAAPLPLSVALEGTGSGTITSDPVGIDCGSECSEDFAVGSMVTLTAASVSTSVFTRWSGDCSGASETCVVTMDAAKNVTATFDLDIKTLTVLVGGTGSGAVTSSLGDIDCPGICEDDFVVGTMVVLDAASTVGSTFDGWTGGGCSGTGPCAVTLDASLSVSATFTLNEYDVVVATSGDGAGTVTSDVGAIACPGTCTDSFTHGSVVTLTASPTSPATFGGWSGDCSGVGATCMLTVTESKSVGASFDEGTASLNVSLAGTGGGTVTSSPGSIDCPGTCSDSYIIDTMVTLTASPDVNSTFTGWSGGGCSGTGSCDVTLSVATSVTATFAEITHPITVATTGFGNGTIVSTPAGIDCGATCMANFGQGSSVTLTAVPETGSVFTGWTGACTGTDPACNLTVTGPGSATATFRAIVFVVGNHGEPNRMYRNLGGTITEIWASPESANTRGISIGDVEPDGDPDIVSADGTDRVRYYRNNGTSPTLVSSEGFASDDSWDVQFADYDGDGDLDFAVGNHSQPLRVYRLVGGGYSQQWSSMESDSDPTVAWGNLDRAEGLDLAKGGSEFTGRIRIYANSITGWGTDLFDMSGGSPFRVTWGDYDGDGDDDLAVGNSYSTFANRVYRNDDGTLVSAYATAIVDDNTYGAEWGDFDGDTDLDLVFGNDGFGPPARVYRNDGSDTFTMLWAATETPARARDATWCDYDGDGDLDVVLANRGEKNSIYEFDGATFTLAWESTEKEDTRAVACGIW